MIDAEVVTDFVPERAIEISVRGQLLRLIFANRGRESARRAFKDVRFAHDVRAQKDRAAIAAREIAFVGQNRRGIAAARLAKVGNHIIDAHGNVFADPLVMIVRQRVFETLQALHRLT